MTRLRPEKFGKVWYRFEEKQPRNEGEVQIHTYIHTYTHTYIRTKSFINKILIILFTMASATMLNEGDETILGLNLHARLRCAVSAYDQTTYFEFCTIYIYIYI